MATIVPWLTKDDNLPNRRPKIPGFLDEVNPSDYGLTPVISTVPIEGDYFLASLILSRVEASDQLSGEVVDEEALR